MEIGRLSGGTFNFQIAPIVDAWGFGKDRQRHESILNPDSLMNLVHIPINYEVMDNSESIHFTKLPDQRIDVNGIAQGYSVDVIFDF